MSTTCSTLVWNCVNVDLDWVRIIFGIIWPRLGENEFCLQVAFWTQQPMQVNTVAAAEKWLIAFSHTYHVHCTNPWIENLQPGWLPPQQSIKQAWPRRWKRTERVLVFEQQFCPRSTISSKLFWVVVLLGWVVASCVVLYNPPPAVVPAWLESQVWTLGPNSNTWFLSDIFRPLFTCFSATFASSGWSGFDPWSAGGTLVAGMAYRVIRMKKEARRNTKLDEIFQVLKMSFRVKLTFDLRKKTERTEAWMEQSQGMSWRRFMKCMRWGNHLNLIKLIKLWGGKI